MSLKFKKKEGIIMKTPAQIRAELAEKIKESASHGWTKSIDAIVEELNAADEKNSAIISFPVSTDPELKILHKILNCLKINDIEVWKEDETLRAQEYSNRWTGAAFYKWLIDEAIVFKDVNKVSGIPDNLFADFSRFAEDYGLVVKCNRRFIGRIDYLDTIGAICESIAYTNEKDFVNTISFKNDIGVPMIVRIYSDKAGNHIDLDWAKKLDPPVDIRIEEVL